MGEQFQKVRGRVLERDLQSLVVKRLHAQLVQRHLAGSDFLGILDGVKDAGITGGGFRVHDAVESEFEIASGDGIAIRPLGVLAHVERVDEAVFGDVP